MKIKRTIDNVVKGIVGLGLLVTMECGGKLEKEIENTQLEIENTQPYYGDHSNTSVTFMDNFAPHMKAYVIYGKEKPKQMVPLAKMKHRYDFYISEEVLNAGEFITYAIDKDGNKSEEKQFYVIDGVVLKK